MGHNDLELILKVGVLWLCCSEYVTEEGKYILPHLSKIFNYLVGMFYSNPKIASLINLLKGSCNRAVYTNEKILSFDELVKKDRPQTFFTYFNFHLKSRQIFLILFKSLKFWSKHLYSTVT